MPRENSVCWCLGFLFLFFFRWMGLNLTKGICKTKFIYRNPLKEVFLKAGLVFAGGLVLQGGRGSGGAGGGGGMLWCRSGWRMEGGRLGSFPRGTQDVCGWDETRGKTVYCPSCKRASPPSMLIKGIGHLSLSYPSRTLELLKTSFELRQSITIASACVCEYFVQPQYKAAVQCLNYPDNPVCLYF